MTGSLVYNKTKWKFLMKWGLWSIYLIYILTIESSGITCLHLTSLDSPLSTNFGLPYPRLPCFPHQFFSKCLEVCPTLQFHEWFQLLHTKLRFLCTQIVWWYNRFDKWPIRFKIQWVSLNQVICDSFWHFLTKRLWKAIHLKVPKW